MLSKVKTALRISVDDYDSELANLINTAKLDMGIAGVVLPDEVDALVEQAVITYCKFSFGSPDDKAEFKKSYDEQKAQLVTATGYTDWGDADV